MPRNISFSVMAVWLIIWAQTLKAAPPEAVELVEDNVLIVQLKYNQILLEESLFVYQTPDHTFIPIQGMIDALDFPLELDLDALALDGWFISEDNTFSLDILKQSVFIKGNRQEWPANFQYAQDGFDLYVDLSSIEDWFGLDLVLDVSQLELLLGSSQPLPVITQKLRAEKRAKLKKKTDKESFKDFLPNEYDWLGAPSFDIELSHSAERSKNETSSLESRHQVSHFSAVTLQGVMDLAKHSLQTSYVNQDGAQDLRLTFNKASRGPSEALFLGINSYQFGDISSQSSSLLTNSSNGGGLHLRKGNDSLEEQSNDLLIEGDAPPGWEVELYRNGALIDFTNSSSTGQYRFENISTYLGENIFDIQIYGPQGQYRTEQKKITVGGQMLAKGLWEFELHALNRNKRLIELEEDEAQNESTFFMSEVNAGINDYLTLQASFSHFTPTDNELAHNYTSLGFFASIVGGLGQLKFVEDQQSGNAWSLSYKTRLFDTNLNFDLENYNHFISDKNPSGDLSLDSKLRINGLWSELLPQTVSYDFEIQHSQFESNLEQWQVSKRLSTRIGKTQVANLFNYTHSNLSDLEDILTGTLSATQRWQSWRFKAEASYRIKPSGVLDSVNTSASYQASKRLNYQASLAFLHSEDDTYSFDNSISWRMDSFVLSLSAGFDSQDHQNVGLTLSSSLGYDKPHKQIYFSSENVASGASVLARTYLDQNNNGQYDEQDSPLANIYFKGKNKWRSSPTNEEGHVTLWNIPDLQMQSVGIDSRRIEDPFIKPTLQQFHLYSHAGKLTEIDIAFQTSMEIEGEIAIDADGRSGRQAGIPVSLYREDGTLVKTSRTEFDGVFILEDILPGSYQLVVNSSYLRSRNLAIHEPIKFQATGEEGVIYLPKLTLKKSAQNLN